MSDKSGSGGRGIGFVGMLTILFVGLKLTNYIDWSWWWVLSPLWISFLVAVLVGIPLVAIVAVAANGKPKWRSR